MTTNVRWILVDENDRPVAPESCKEEAIMDLKILLEALEESKIELR